MTLLPDEQPPPAPAQRMLAWVLLCMLSFVFGCAGGIVLEWLLTR